MQNSIQRFFLIVVLMAVGVWGLRLLDKSSKPTNSISSHKSKSISSHKSQPTSSHKSKSTSSHKSEMIFDKSGLKYMITKLGTGVQARAGQTVKVHYTGWLLAGYNADGTPKKGKQFDSSRGRGIFSFPLGKRRVIRGWDIGVAMMKVGGRRILVIPPHLGYGASGAGTAIPPNATLIFDVELIGIN